MYFTTLWSTLRFSDSNITYGAVFLFYFTEQPRSLSLSYSRRKNEKLQKSSASNLFYQTL